jgi:tetratricopeptide (TPR) repeat protein
MLFHGGGYTGASPTSDENLRLKEIAVVGAGPAASLLNGLVFLAIFFLLPSTAWQSWWWIAAYNAMLGIVLGVSNLMPVGYSDGSMLFHLILGTEPGRALLARHRAETLQEEATELHERAEYEKEIELKRQILERVIEAGEGNAMAIAICRQKLGHAYLAAEDWPAAEAEFRLCREQETECAVNPGLAANVHAGLVWTSSRRQHPAETGRAYAAALTAIRPGKQRKERLQRTLSCAMLAQIHVRAASYDATIEETREGLDVVPGGPEGTRLKVALLLAQAEAQLCLGWIGDANESCETAAELLRSAKIPAGRRNLAWADLGDLGKILWRAGQAEPAIGYLREAVDRLEAGGARTTAAAHRIRLCAILRQSGRAEEGAARLPDEAGLPPYLVRTLLAEKVQLHLYAGRPREAVSEARTLVELWRANPVECATELASAEALLARAHLEAGDTSEASDLAQSAFEALDQRQHPDAAGCRITAALADNGVSMEAMAAARRLIEAALLVSPAEKERLISELESRVSAGGKAAAAAVSG